MEKITVTMKTILCLSSGLDSYIAWHELGKPECIHFTGHSRYSGKELATIEYMQKVNPEMKVKVIDLSQMGLIEEENGNIPGRNLLFLLVAAHHGNHICLVCQRGEQNTPDRSPKFFNDATMMIGKMFGKPLLTDQVFPNMTKMDMVKYALEQLHIPASNLLDCYSCLSSETGRCGCCAACARTACALDYCDVLPPNYFNRDIWKWEGWKIYIEKMRDGKYEPIRTSQTMEVLKKRGLV